MVFAGGTNPDAVNPYVQIPTYNLEDGFTKDEPSYSITNDLTNVFNPGLGQFTNLSGATATANNVNDSYTNGENSEYNGARSIEDLFHDLLVTAQNQNQLSYQTAREVREFNHNEAELERKWQEAMRDSQIKSTMKQLKEAGINPLLALTGSLGYANASSGSTATASNPSYANDNAIISALIVALAGVASSIFRSNPLMKAALAA